MCLGCKRKDEIRLRAGRENYLILTDYRRSLSRLQIQVGCRRRGLEEVEVNTGAVQVEQGSRSGEFVMYRKQPRTVMNSDVARTDTVGCKNRIGKQSSRVVCSEKSRRPVCCPACTRHGTLAGNKQSNEASGWPKTAIAEGTE